MNYMKSLLVLCLVGCCLAAPKPIDWDSFGRKVKDFGHKVHDKLHEVKEKILPAAKSTCEFVNSISPDTQQDNFGGYYPQQRRSFPDIHSFKNQYHNTHFGGFPQFPSDFHKPHFHHGFDQHSNFPKFHPFHKFFPNHHFPTSHPFPSIPSYTPSPPIAEHPTGDVNTMAPPPNPPMGGFDLVKPGTTTTKVDFNEFFTVPPSPSSSEAGDAVAHPTSPVFTSSVTSESTINFDLPADSDEQGGSNDDETPLFPDNSGEQGDSQEDPDFPFLNNNDNTGGFDNAAPPVSENTIEEGGADNDNVFPQFNNGEKLDNGGQLPDETIEQADMNVDDDIPPFIAPKDENGVENNDGFVPQNFFNNFEVVDQRPVLPINSRARGHYY
ncbi:unnamed protein product [Phyllotreta striolata]|uniref:Uncharacterized protein n=1 Tax=Phyllotreta striolata TaxID=444603 RepID=A0A9N9TIF5_PHYSR|nr:unnamed protein product [Phyllotreta striolata]